MKVHGYGIDVSCYQGTINWAKVKKAGCRFAILKCINKSLALDAQFSANVAGCRKNSIPASAYTYVYENTVGGALLRAKAAVSAMQAQGMEQGCTLWWDVEDTTIRKPKLKDQLTTSILAARALVEQAGYAFGVYCDLDFYRSCLDADTIGGKWWIARYCYQSKTAFGKAPLTSAKPSIKEELCGWQYTSKGVIAGIDGYVDLNISYDSHFETADGDAESTVETTLNKVEKYKGYVTASALKVRMWAGVKYDTCNFSPLKHMDEISVCDTITADDGSKWLYICYGGQYGFVSAQYVYNGMFRVRPSWAQTDKQKGAFVLLSNAKECADEYAGYSVYMDDGTSVYTSKCDNLVTYKDNTVTLNGQSVTVWNQHKLTGENSKALSQHGCGITSTAIVSCVAGAKITPEKLVEKALDLWGDARKYFPLISCRGAVALLKELGVSADFVAKPSKHDIDKALKAGKPCICWTYAANEQDPFSNTNHYIVAVGYNVKGNIVIANCGNAGPVQVVTLETLMKYLKAGNGKDTTWYNSVSGSAGVVVVDA